MCDDNRKFFRTVWNSQVQRKADNPTSGGTEILSLNLPSDLQYRFVYAFCERFAASTGNGLTAAGVKHETQLLVQFRDDNGNITAEFPLGDSYNPTDTVESAFVASDAGPMVPDAVLIDIPTTFSTVFARPVCVPLRVVTNAVRASVVCARINAPGYVPPTAIRCFLGVRSSSHPL